MAKILNLYKGEELVSSEEVTGEKTTVSVDGLEPGTNYPKGTYKVSFENDSGESEKVDVPEFTTESVEEPVTDPDPEPEPGEE